VGHRVRGTPPLSRLTSWWVRSPGYGRADPLCCTSHHWLPGRAADPLSDLTRHSEREAHTEKSNAEIARTLYLVEVTVKAHVSSILIKLDARNRVQAAILAYEAGLA
jgi:DNA-binding CsgD family transcriptional regulator